MRNTTSHLNRIAKATMIFSLFAVISLHGLAALPPLIPRALLFGNPGYMSPIISPDGTQIAYLKPDTNHVMQVWVCNLAGNGERQITHELHQGISWWGQHIFWAYNGRLLFLKDSDGNELEHLFVCDSLTGEARDLTPFSGIKATIVACEPAKPNQVLITLNRNGKEVFDLWSANLMNGALTPVMRNPGDITSWIADASLELRAAIATGKDGSGELRLLNKNNTWKTLYSWNAADTVQAIGISKDGKEIYLKSNVDADTTALCATEIGTGRLTKLFSDPQADLQDTLINPKNRTVQAVTCYRLKPQWYFFDKSIVRDMAGLAKVSPDYVNVMSRDLKDEHWIVSSGDTNLPGYYVWNRQQQEATYLFPCLPELKNYKLSSTKCFELKARDGLSLPSYLTLPDGVEANNLPMIVDIHGGPRLRDGWGFGLEKQWLANRGYAVLQVNYRGSRGFGKAFMHAGDLQLAGKMHDDIIDGVNWAINQGIADPKRIAIMGGSYGGYETLVGLTFTPDVFAAGVDECGFADVRTFLENAPAYWKPFMPTYWYQLAGNPDNPADQREMEMRSPLFHVDAIKAPLLVGQGANDPRVKKKESDQMVAALRKAGKQVDYIVFPDEGHGFQKPENNRRFYAVTEQFLTKYLGGRCEPATEDEQADKFRQ